MSVEQILQHVNNKEKLLSEFFNEYCPRYKFLQKISEDYSYLVSCNSKNLEEKCKEIGSIKKLYSTLAEFETAKYFAKNGYSITFLSQSDNRDNNGNERQYPDIYVENEKNKVLIEVYREFDKSASKRINRILKEIIRNTHYVISFNVRDKLSRPPLDYNRIEDQKKCIFSEIGEFIHRLCENPPKSFPCDIETENIIFSNKKGY